VAGNVFVHGVEPGLARRQIGSVGVQRINMRTALAPGPSRRTKIAETQGQNPRASAMLGPFVEIEDHVPVEASDPICSDSPPT
jgi:hypothetical protein